MTNVISMQRDEGCGEIVVIRFSLNFTKAIAAWTWLRGRLVPHRRWDRLSAHLLHDIGKSECEAEIETLRRISSRPAPSEKHFSWDRLPPSA